MHTFFVPLQPTKMICHLRSDFNLLLIRTSSLLLIKVHSFRNLHSKRLHKNLEKTYKKLSFKDAFKFQG